MPDQEIYIEELKIRIPGEYKKDAEEIGRDVSRYLAELLPDSMRGRKQETLNLSVNIPRETSGSQMARTIAETIISGLK